MRFAILIVLAAAIQACAVGSKHRVVYVDDSFRQDEIDGIEEACRRWEEAVPGVGFADVRVVARKSIDDETGKGLFEKRWSVEDAAVYVVKKICYDERLAGSVTTVASTATFYSNENSENDWAIITVCSDRTRGMIIPVLLHELGHARGLDHRPWPSVMTSHEVPLDDMSTRPTDDDVAYMTDMLRHAKP